MEILGRTLFFKATGVLLSLAVYLEGAPQGESVVHGEASFSAPTPDFTRIEALDNTIINYDSFDIGVSETVQFVQPDVTSRVFNRVMGSAATNIDGTLLGNGQVYLVNPSGIYFGATAVVDVGGLFAAAGQLSDQDFLDKIDRFTDLMGPVYNYGKLQGDAIHLYGRLAANFGSIVAPGGVVSVAVGDEVWVQEKGYPLIVQLSDPGAPSESTTPDGEEDVFLGAGDLYAIAIKGTGSIEANKIAVNSGEKGYSIIQGRLDASSDEVGERGGLIEVLGSKIALVDASLDVSGRAGGGEIRIGGDYQGQGDTPTADWVSADRETTISADALDSGDGGKVILWADGWTGSNADVSAQGGPNGGDGGFVEISGKEGLSFDGSVNTLAPMGDAGLVLFDPDVAVIAEPAADSGSGFSVPPPKILFNDDPGMTVTISTPTLRSQLLLGNVLIQAVDQVFVGTGAAASVNLVGPFTTNLTIETYGNINVNKSLQWGGNNLTLSVLGDANHLAKSIVTNGIINLGNGEVKLEAISLGGMGTSTYINLNAGIVGPGTGLLNTSSLVIEASGGASNAIVFGAAGGEFGSFKDVTLRSDGNLTTLSTMPRMALDILAPGGVLTVDVENVLALGDGDLELEAYGMNQSIDLTSSTITLGGDADNLLIDSPMTQWGGSLMSTTDGDVTVTGALTANGTGSQEIISGGAGSSVNLDTVEKTTIGSLIFRANEVGSSVNLQGDGPVVTAIGDIEFDTSTLNFTNPSGEDQTVKSLIGKITVDGDVVASDSSPREIHFDAKDIEFGGNVTAVGNKFVLEDTALRPDSKVTFTENVVMVSETLEYFTDVFFEKDAELIATDEIIFRKNLTVDGVTKTKATTEVGFHGDVFLKKPLLVEDGPLVFYVDPISPPPTFEVVGPIEYINLPPLEPPIRIRGGGTDIIVVTTPTEFPPIQEEIFVVPPVGDPFPANVIPVYVAPDNISSILGPLQSEPELAAWFGRDSWFGDLGLIEYINTLLPKEPNTGWLPDSDIERPPVPGAFGHNNYVGQEQKDGQSDYTNEKE